MKKLFILLFIIILFSCEKNKIICWECTIQQTKNIIVLLQYCNKTAAEIIIIENLHTFYHNLYGEFWYQTCVCTQIK